MQHPKQKLGPEEPVPAGFDYDLWCGPAAKLPYISGRYWLNMAEYSCGPIPGDAVHQLDLARFAMGDPAAPKTVSHTGGILALRDGRDTPDTQFATFEYDGFTLHFEGALWSGYMKKTPFNLRDRDAFSDWTFNATKIELLGTKGFMYLGRHGDALPPGEYRMADRQQETGLRRQERIVPRRAGRKPVLETAELSCAMDSTRASVSDTIPSLKIAILNPFDPSA
jgi:predicted dehydrogenase